MKDVNDFTLEKCEFCGVYRGQLHHPNICPKGKPPDPDPGEPTPMEGKGQEPPLSP